MEAEAGKPNRGKQAGRQAIIDADTHTGMDESGDWRREAARQRETGRLPVAGTKRQAGRNREAGKGR
jgi:hypothetical protein